MEEATKVGRVQRWLASGEGMIAEAIAECQAEGAKAFWMEDAEGARSAADRLGALLEAQRCLDDLGRALREAGVGDAGESVLCLNGKPGHEPVRQWSPGAGHAEVAPESEPDADPGRQAPPETETPTGADQAVVSLPVPPAEPAGEVRLTVEGLAGDVHETEAVDDGREAGAPESGEGPARDGRDGDAPEPVGTVDLAALATTPEPAPLAPTPEPESRPTGDAKGGTLEELAHEERAKLRVGPGTEGALAGTDPATEPSEAEVAEARRDERARIGRESADAAREVYGVWRELESREEWGLPDVARAKSAVCKARAAMVGLRKARPEEAHTLAHELMRFGDAYGRRVDPGTFYGFNTATDRSPETWEALAEAYGLMAIAEEAVEWAEQNPAASADRTRVLELAASAQMTVYRLILGRFAGVHDAHQKALHERLKGLLDGVTVHAWLMGGPNALSDDEVAREARALPQAFKRAAESGQARLRKAAAADTLRSLLTDAPREDFEDRLVEAVDAALEAGIPPSDKGLRREMQPFRFLMTNLKSSHRARFCQYLDTDAVPLQRKKIVDQDLPEDEEFAGKEAAVRESLAGKSLLLVGGNKGQQWRRDELKERLGLKEVEWPDMEPDTRMGKLQKPIDRADVVLYLVRFSRHSYKWALDEAKRQGKPGVTITQGLGYRRMVTAIHDQVVAPARRAVGAR